jgi:hypothetical protein
MRRVGIAVALLAAALACGADSRAEAPVPGPHVTMITDSVGGVLFWVDSARTALASGFDFDLETKTCRKLVDPGCPAYGDPAPISALDTVRALGSKLGPIVVVDVGYNDRPDTYAAGLDQVMQAAVDGGAQHVIWLTLEEREGAWKQINDEIRAATTHWPQLTVADWNAASAGQDWFVDDAHLNWSGGQGLSQFLRPFLISACGSTCATPPLRFCGLALTVHGFDPVQAGGVACSDADVAVVRAEHGDSSEWSCTRATDGEVTLDCTRGFTRVQVLARAPGPVSRRAGVVSLADWSFRLQGHLLQGRQGQRRWRLLGRAPFCLPVAPLQVLAALPLRRVAATGCFAPR